MGVESSLAHHIKSMQSAWYLFRTQIQILKVLKVTFQWVKGSFIVVGQATSHDIVILQTKCPFLWKEQLTYILKWLECQFHFDINSNSNTLIQSWGKWGLNQRPFSYWMTTLKRSLCDPEIYFLLPYVCANKRLRRESNCSDTCLCGTRDTGWHH